MCRGGGVSLPPASGYSREITACYLTHSGGTARLLDERDGRQAQPQPPLVSCAHRRMAQADDEPVESQWEGTVNSLSPV